LIELRNPWKVLDLDLNWGVSSNLWTEKMKERVKPNLESDDTFFMSYEDFVVNFDLVHICMVDKFQEIQTKGVFRIFGMEHAFTTKAKPKSISLTEAQEALKIKSLFHYMINIKEDNTKLILGLHQEDENDQGVKLTRPYLDIGKF
jgi:hypothetical protein